MRGDRIETFKINHHNWYRGVLARPVKIISRWRQDPVNILSVAQGWLCQFYVTLLVFLKQLKADYASSPWPYWCSDSSSRLTIPVLRDPTSVLVGDPKLKTKISTIRSLRTPQRLQFKLALNQSFLKVLGLLSITLSSPKMVSLRNGSFIWPLRSLPRAWHPSEDCHHTQRGTGHASSHHLV